VNGGGKYDFVKSLDKRPALSEMREILGTHFTCFTSTKVQILTHLRSCAAAELQLDALDGEPDQKVLSYLFC
jgi:hypothetical protein